MQYGVLKYIYILKCGTFFQSEQYINDLNWGKAKQQQYRMRIKKNFTRYIENSTVTK